MPKEKDAYRQLVYQLPRVKKFIDRISRKKERTGIAYLTGLVNFNKYLESTYQKNCNSIIDYLEERPKELYDVLDGFVAYLENTLTGIQASTIRNYMYALLSYFPSYEIDIISSKFKRQVSMPNKQRTKERPITQNEIRTLLNLCDSRRSKAYLLFLASSGCRAQSEACNVRNKDINFDESPTRVFIRADNNKTNTSRYVYISDEATRFIRDFQRWKYSERPRYIEQEDGTKKHLMVKQEYGDNDLLFSVYDRDTEPRSIYTRLSQEFIELLESAGLNQQKEGGYKSRNQFSLNSFRRFVYTTIEKQVNTGYAEYFLGHANSPYHTETEDSISQTYKEKCMSYLTFTDYSSLEAKGRSLESQMQSQQEVLSELKKKDAEKEKEVLGYLEMFQKLVKENDEQKARIAELEKLSTQNSSTDRLDRLEQIMKELQIHTKNIKRAG